jgi:hypothetical protein
MSNLNETEKNEIVEKVKLKRGRKKKWHTGSDKNYSVNLCEVVTFSETSKNPIVDESFDNLNFGNLTIKVKEKECKKIDILNFFNEEKRNSECNIFLSSDEEDMTENIPTKKEIHIFKNGCKKDIKTTDIRCYYCHHSFNNLPYYIPLNYCAELDRYKLFGNFCSPSCSKSYCISNKIFENKMYLLEQFYKALFGPDFKIYPSPSFLKLKVYGGTMSIEEFRKSSYVNNRYTLNVLNKVIFID